MVERILDCEGLLVSSRGSNLWGLTVLLSLSSHQPHAPMTYSLTLETYFQYAAAVAAHGTVSDVVGSVLFIVEIATCSGLQPAREDGDLSLARC